MTRILHLPVARLALSRCGLIEDYALPTYIAFQFVTVAAWDVTVRTRKRERRAFVVIEQRRLPSRRVMATGAIGSVSTSSKLTSVRVLMAGKALLRSFVEVHILQAGLLRWRTMAVAARHAPVGPKKRKLRFRVVETVELFPVRGCVAGLAAKGGAVGALGLHALPELAFVRIKMASGAGAVLKPVFHRNRRAGRHRLVAIRADHRNVRAGQWKARLLVASQRKTRRLEPLQVVTRLAAILVGRSRELSFVNVFMTIFALRLRDFEEGVFVLRPFR